jgi:hypothetical protein
MTVAERSGIRVLKVVAVFDDAGALARLLDTALAQV